MIKKYFRGKKLTRALPMFKRNQKKYKMPPLKPQSFRCRSRKSNILKCMHACTHPSATNPTGSKQA